MGGSRIFARGSNLQRGLDLKTVPDTLIVYADFSSNSS